MRRLYLILTCRCIPALHSGGQRGFTLHLGTKPSTVHRIKNLSDVYGHTRRGGGGWMHHASNLNPELYHVGIMSGNQTLPRCFETSQWISSREYL